MNKEEMLEEVEENEELEKGISITEAFKIIAWHILSCAEELKKAGYNYSDFDY